ncbi:MAG: hypothetical protein Q4G03_09635 [Planctomycetia bacterium]|nr:hypothetical protein [Planctomycetia bacterium]
MSKRANANEEPFSLFPFLAVLLCTMGVLAMIFVLVAQKTSDSTAAEEAISPEETSEAFDAQLALGSDGVILTEPPQSPARDDVDDDYARALLQTDAASLEDLRDAKESGEWFLQQLQETRERSGAALERERERLANAEQALAKLREEQEVMRRKYQALLSEEPQDALAIQEAVDAVDKELEALKAQAEELRQKNANAKRSYAILPYQGANGVFRRPIYIECNSAGVFIMPEGVRFNQADFLVARYPGNPFDVALRAVAATYQRQSGPSAQIEPYPLIIVRPSGAEFFYSAIAALASWGELYGYEFVEEDQEIEYPAPNPVLTQTLTEQINFARARLYAQIQEALSVQRAQLAREDALRREAQRAGFNAGGNTGQSELQNALGVNARLGVAHADGASEPVGGAGAAVALGQGGFDVRSGLPMAPGNDSNFIPPEYHGVYAQNQGVAPSAPSGEASLALRQGGGSATGATPTLNPAQGQFVQNNAYGATTDNLNANVAATDGSVANRAMSQGGQDQPGDASASTTSGVAQTLTGNNVASASGPTDANTAQYVPYSAASNNLVATLQGGQPSENARPIDQPQVDPNKTLGNTAYGRNGQGTSSTGTTLANDSAKHQERNEPKDNVPKEAISITKELLRPATGGNERAVVIICYPDSIVFPKQPGARQALTIPYDAQRAQTPEFEKELLDAFVLYVKSWGLAGRNMYWAPYARAQVAPNGEACFESLQAFCRDQGVACVRADFTGRAQ